MVNIVKNNLASYIKNIIFPCFILSGITGILTGIVILLFKALSGVVISWSENIYAFVRDNPHYFPFLVIGAALIGLSAALLLHIEPNSRGGGIPTAIAILRGLIEFKWLKSLFMIFTSSMLTYLCGIPLGNEGPSVQMGTSIGRGTVSLFAKNNPAWDRYIMTGGACAGFASATGAPLSGIMFSFEEAHRRYSPMLFMVSATTVIASFSTTKALGSRFRVGTSLFDLELNTVLPLESIWTAALIGIICGISAIIFTKLYSAVGHIINEHAKKIPFAVKIVTVFVLVAIIGFFLNECIGSGHSLAEQLIEGSGIWYMLIIYLCLRAILLTVANVTGVTGGVFVPTLAFGAIIGSLCATALVSTGLISPESYPIFVTVGMTSFMSAASRTPLTAICFGCEALCGFSNIIAHVVGATISFLVIETFGIGAFSDTVIKSKEKKEHSKKTASIVDAYLTVKPNSFVIGKEIRDILWPPFCVVLSLRKAPDTDKHSSLLAEGDILHIHYQTYDLPYTAKKLEELIGVQDNDTRTKMHTSSARHSVPEI